MPDIDVDEEDVPESAYDLTHEKLGEAGPLTEAWIVGMPIPFFPILPSYPLGVTSHTLAVSSRYRLDLISGLRGRAGWGVGCGWVRMGRDGARAEVNAELGRPSPQSGLPQSGLRSLHSMSWGLP